MCQPVSVSSALGNERLFHVAAQAALGFKLTTHFCNATYALRTTAEMTCSISAVSH